MTRNSYKGLAIALEQNVDDEYVESMVRVIQAMAGVASVQKVNTDVLDDMVVTMRVNTEWRQRLVKLLDYVGPVGEDKA